MVVVYIVLQHNIISLNEISRDVVLYSYLVWNYRSYPLYIHMNIFTPLLL